MTSILNICPARREMKEGQWTPHTDTHKVKRTHEIASAGSGHHNFCNFQVSTVQILQLCTKDTVNLSICNILTRHGHTFGEL